MKSVTGALPCKNCAYFQRPKNTNIPVRFGSCKYFYEINCVDGSMMYEYHVVAHDLYCKGTLFQEEAAPKDLLSKGTLITLFIQENEKMNELTQSK